MNKKKKVGDPLDGKELATAESSKAFLDGMKKREEERLKDPKAINETDGTHKQWYVQAKDDMTLAKLPEFLRHLMEDYRHDYGMVCHALAAGAIATCWAMNRTEQGGITGFQSGAVMWEFIQNWMHYEGSLRMIQYRNMLYPQYQDQFEKTISPDTWKDLQEQANKLIGEHNTGAVGPVAEHWRSIIVGNVPFGYTVKES